MINNATEEDEETSSLTKTQKHLEHVPPQISRIELIFIAKKKTKNNYKK